MNYDPFRSSGPSKSDSSTPTTPDFDPASPKLIGKKCFLIKFDDCLINFGDSGSKSGVFGVEESDFEGPEGRKGSRIQILMNSPWVWALAKFLCGPHPRVGNFGLPPETRPNPQATGHPEGPQKPPTLKFPTTSIWAVFPQGPKQGFWAPALLVNPIFWSKFFPGSPLVPMAPPQVPPAPGRPRPGKPIRAQFKPT